MASDGGRIFVLGGDLSPDAQVVAKPIHILDTSMYFFFGHFIWIATKFENTEHLHFPKHDFDTINPSEKSTQLVRKSSASPSIEEQSHQPPSSSDAHAVHDDTSVRKTTQEEQDHPTSPQITHVRNTSLNGLPSQPTGVDDKPR